MKKGIAAAILAVTSYLGAAHAADQPMIHKVTLKSGGMGYLLDPGEFLSTAVPAMIARMREEEVGAAVFLPV